MKAWTNDEAYEHRVGRWSHLVARKFLAWLRLGRDLRWLDVGCGTGALTRAILDRCVPGRVIGIDPDGVGYARRRLAGDRVELRRGSAGSIPFPDGHFDAAVAGLVLNLLDDRDLAEMKRVVRPGGCVAGYVWDFGGSMQPMRRFWDAAISLDPKAARHDPGQDVGVCAPGPLADLLERASLRRVKTRALDVPTVFVDFEDCWRPFVSGEGAIPDYCRSLSKPRLSALRARLRDRLQARPDGRISLFARAWAARGIVPG